MDDDVYIIIFFHSFSIHLLEKYVSVIIKTSRDVSLSVSNVLTIDSNNLKRRLIIKYRG